MSSYEAVRRLQKFQRVYCYGSKYSWKKTSLMMRSYADTLISILIEKIEEYPEEDPIVIIKFLQSDIEDLMCMSENERTRTFCSHMMEIYKEILKRII